MTLYVIDSSVAVKWVLPELDTPQVLALRDDAWNGVHDIIAPDLFASEVAHALTKAERRKIIPVGDAATHLFDILQNGPALHTFLPLLPRAVEISSATRVAVTDCVFVALAERENCEFVSADERAVKNLVGYPILSLASLGT
jgi:predicted nucleic acid-binding protein